MELRHLRYFVAVCEAQNFAKAAAQLRIAQPSLSRRVQDLEDEIGVDLLKRSPRGVTITAEGKLFLEDAREVLKRADESVEKENPRFLIRVNDVSTFASQPRCPVNYNAEQPCTIEGLLLSPGRLRFDCGCEVRIHAQLREHDAEKGVAVELLDLAVFHVPKVGAWDVKLGSGRLDDACGRLERPGEGAPDRQLDRDDVP